MQFTPELSAWPPRTTSSWRSRGVSGSSGARRRSRGGSGRGWVSWVSALSWASALHRSWPPFSPVAAGRRRSSPPKIPGTHEGCPYTPCPSRSSGFPGASSSSSRAWGSRLWAGSCGSRVPGSPAGSAPRSSRSWTGRSAGDPNKVLPLWLLKEPRPLSHHDGWPYLCGPLEAESGPERIESGWWDGQDIARDYFIVRDPHGARFWIYRDLGDASAWYLHGVFD